MRQRLFDDKHPDVASSLGEPGDPAGRHPPVLARGAGILAQGGVHPHRRVLGHALEDRDRRKRPARAAQTGLGNYAEAEKLLTRSYAILRKRPSTPVAFRTLTERYLQTLHEQEHAGRKPARAAQATRSSAAVAAPAAPVGQRAGDIRPRRLLRPRDGDHDVRELAASPAQEQ